MDKIIMEKMEFYGYHGVFPEERKLGQKFTVDTVLYLPLASAGKSDDLNETINYAEVYEVIKKIMEQQSYELIETLAEKIASTLLKTYTKINEITVKVTKPNPPFDIHFSGVAVEIHRKSV
ncbi:dihydroneopterin aldolase [Chengkuizengella axinellae]|uniref:7,8-dihydroneopterin aldolase n=1 Tax=Chengkuizengella axinellae TaxID=3064388 RepID=A0ABT9J7N8_9BACL|nr:dihydroneopterin aldolase [Chengkuizengella sp. 2205SS18-9]MDP5276974.1 dihydroneopterin aldolase [Chengkuizengella sp. 2205SS18-9]